MPAQARFNAARQRAAILARKGHYDQSLAELSKLQREYRGNIDLVRDRTAILSWAGRNQESVSLYEQKLRGDQPDYVLDAVAHSYRVLGKPDRALALYQRGYARSPNNEAFAVGIIRCLTDQGFIERAIAFANEDLRRHGNRLEVLLAAADAADQYNMYEAQKYYETAAKIAPHNKQVVLGLIRNADRMGNPQLALQYADQYPGMLPADEYRRIQGDEVSAEVRLAMTQTTTTDQNAATDRALAHLDSLIAQWSQQGPDAQKAILRARYDRIIALHNRSRMQEVVTEYNALQQQGAPIPNYALGAVGDAYLDMHEPEKARALYLQALQTDPNNYLLRRQLFYSYVDFNDYKDAYQTVDALVADQPMYVTPKGGAPEVNPDWQSAQLLAGSARLFAGDVAAADKIITPVATAMPNSPAATKRSAMFTTRMAGRVRRSPNTRPATISPTARASPTKSASPTPSCSCSTSSRPKR